jgi:hypothetical protein
MLMSYRHGQSGIILRLKILDATKSDGAGLTGLAFNSPDLVVSTIADSESAPVSYVANDGKIESISTLGTYQQPTATRCRFREVHSTHHRGVYELHLSDARFAATGAKSVLISVTGGPSVAESDALIVLSQFDPYAPNGGFDPWSVALPASYAPGTAGARVGLLDAAVSTRLAASTYAAPPTVAAIVAAVWDEPADSHMATGSFGARLDAQVSSRSTFSGDSVGSVANPVTVGVNNDKSGYLLAPAGLDPVVIEPGINARQAFSPILAALAGVVVGAGSETIQFKGGNSSTTRITAALDTLGNRTSVSLTLPG